MTFDMTNLTWFIDTDNANRGISLGYPLKRSDTALPCSIPSMIQQYFPDYHGVAFYWCEFTPDPDLPEGEICYLRFEGVDYKADVWCDGVFLGSHEGAEAPFAFDISSVLRKQAHHLLSVRVVNPTGEDIDGLNLANTPCRNKTLGHSAGSGFNCGGIWYGVKIISLPRIYLDECRLIGDIDHKTLAARIRIRNLSEEVLPAQVSVDVYERGGIGSHICGVCENLNVAHGISSSVLTVTVPQLRLWSCEDPNLYRIEIRITSAAGVHSVIRSFGFRDFRVGSDGFFYLNHRRIFLRSSHTGNNFPIGMMIPTVREQMRSDLTFAKASGFNMIRSIAGVLRPEQLDLCDEIGLMVYEENYASWGLGYGCKAELGSRVTMLKRYEQCTLDMIRRDCNHPCITVWGMLNESPKDAVFEKAVGMLSQVMDADPTRLVLLNAGRFDYDLTVGSCANPGSRKWQTIMGIDGTVTKGMKWNCPGGFGASLQNSGDYHMYPIVPLTRPFCDSIRSLGHGEGVKAVFYSETGIGSLFDVIEEARMFEAYGADPKLEDNAWVHEQADMLNRDWRLFGLENVFPNAEIMLKESQRLCSAERTEIFNIIRSNPRISGYSLTGFLDHGMCGEGLISMWRRPKPGVFDALTDGWDKLRFCLFSKRNLFTKEQPEYEVVLSTEDALPPGEYVAEITVSDDLNGPVYSVNAPFSIPEDRPFAVPVIHERLPMTLNPGDYTLSVTMPYSASPNGAYRHFHVTDVEHLPALKQQIHTIGIEPGTVDLLDRFGVGHDTFSGHDSGLILAGAAIGTEEIRALSLAAQSGAKVLFLSCDPFTKEEACSALGIDADLRLEDLPDWLYHKECIVTRHPIFSSFRAGIADFPTFGDTFPHLVFSVKRLPDEMICPAFLTGYYAIPGSYGSYWAISSFTVGKGSITLNCFRLEHCTDEEPAAVRMLYNMIKNRAE